MVSRGLDTTPEMGPAELRAIGFFHDKTAPSLSSYFDAEFWTRLVFQMSYAEPSIRHAMVALGALHETRETGVKMVPSLFPGTHPAYEENVMHLIKRPDVQDEQFALNQYNKAIMSLSKRLSGDTSIEVALMACILFVCIEFLRGDAEPAVKHFNSGMQIALATLSNRESKHAKATVARIKEHILPFFNRIELLSTLFGHDASWEYQVDLHDAVPKTFRNMRDARDSVVHLANISVRFIRYMKYRKYERFVLPDDLARQEAILLQYDIWAETLDKLLLSDEITERDLDAAKTLRIHQVVGATWVTRCTTPEESKNDESMTEFETVVGLAEAIQNIAGTSAQRKYMDSSSFLFDMEIVSPLYYVGTKCRHPVIRRRAIQILKGTQRREGLWDSNMAAAVAERIMLLEEANLTTLDGSELPKEEDRIHNTQIKSEPGINPRKHNLCFYTRPKGMDGPWHTWSEQIVLP